MTTKPIVYWILVFLAFSPTITVINNNINVDDQGARASQIQIFLNQLEWISRKKFKIFAYIFHIFILHISYFHISYFHISYLYNFHIACNDVILHVICGLEPPNQKFWLRLCQNSRNFYVWLFSFQPIKKQCCPRAEDRTYSRTCKVRGQGQGRQSGSSKPITF